MQVAVAAAVVAAIVAIFAVGHHAKPPVPAPVVVAHHVAPVHHAVVPVPTPAPIPSPPASSHMPPIVAAPLASVPVAPPVATPAPVAPVAVVAQVEKSKVADDHFALVDIGILVVLAVIIVVFLAKRMKPKAKEPAKTTFVAPIIIGGAGGPLKVSAVGSGGPGFTQSPGAVNTQDPTTAAFLQAQANAANQAASAAAVQASQPASPPA